MSKYVKPMIVSTTAAATLIQFSIAKPGLNPDGGDGSTSSYRSDE